MKYLISILLSFLSPFVFKAQVRPQVFYPVQNAYSSSRSGSALLSNGDSLNGKFYYHSRPFSSKVCIYYYVGGQASNLKKIPVDSISKIVLIGKKSGQSYMFQLTKNELCFIGNPNVKIRTLNRRTFKKIK